MCFSSGKDQANRAAYSNAVDLYKKNQAIDSLNWLFGQQSDLSKGGPPKQPRKAFNLFRMLDPFATVQGPLGIFGLGTGSDAIGIYDAFRAGAGGQKIGSPYDQEILVPDQTKIDENKAARDKLYGLVGDDTRNYFNTDLNQQRSDASNNVLASLARNGLLGGTADSILGNKLEQDYSKGVLGVSNRAEDAMNKARGSDEQTRLDLINRIQSGMSAGDALSSAGKQLTANLQDAQANERSNTLGDLFSNIAQAYQYQQLPPNVRAQMLLGSGVGTGGTGRGYYGTNGSGY